MKMFYLVATNTWNNKPQVLCAESSIERYGYDGADLNIDLSFAPAEEVNGYLAGNICLLTSEQIEAVMQFKNLPWGAQDKRVIYGNTYQKWQELFKNYTVEVKEVEIKL